LLDAGAKYIDLVDSVGIIALGREKMNVEKDRLAKLINAEDRRGSLAEAMKSADVFIGVSKPGLVTREMVASMNPRSIIFALANPTPEIMPEEALAAGAEVIATGRSDYPNQVNNVLVYPGLFRGLLDGRIRKLTSTMKLAAAQALASTVKNPEKQCILPSILEENPAESIRRAILQA
jgi:malate dehydrogenase (oxaloacetate-decarboxylating)